MKKEGDFKKGDRLFILNGKDKGKIGALLKVFPEKKRVLVQGLNMVTRHTKANQQAGEAGGRIKKESPVHISNVALVCPKCTDPTRVAHQFLKDPNDSQAKPRKVRVCKRCKAQIDPE